MRVYSSWFRFPAERQAGSIERANFVPILRTLDRTGEGETQDLCTKVDKGPVRNHLVISAGHYEEILEQNWTWTLVPTVLVGW